MTDYKDEIIKKAEEEKAGLEQAIKHAEGFLYLPDCLLPPLNIDFVKEIEVFAFLHGSLPEPGIMK